MSKLLKDILAEDEKDSNGNKGVARWVGGPEVERVKEKQKREKDGAEDRGNQELSAARRKDFDDAEQSHKDEESAKKVKRSSRKKNLKEYLEDATDELVASYRENIPGQ